MKKAFAAANAFLVKKVKTDEETKTENSKSSGRALGKGKKTKGKVIFIVSKFSSKQGSTK